MIPARVGISVDSSGCAGVRHAAASETGPVGGGDALRCIENLREVLRHVGALSIGGADDGPARKVSASLEQIMVEHRGMADELISVYEQLGIIFEVTRKLPTVNSESEVIGLFVDSLRRSFAGREVFVAHPPSPGVHAGRSDPPDINVWARGDAGGESADALSLLLHRACRSTPARTVVESLPPVDSGAPGADYDPPVSPLGKGGGCQDVLVGPVLSGEQLVCAIVIVRSVPLEGDPTAPPFRASDMQLVESLTTFCGDLIRSRRLVREMHEMSIAVVHSLVSAVDQKDEYTCGHSLRVGYYATVLGRLLNLRGDELQMLQWAALLHDVGKIGIRDDVLKKQGKLTPDEFKHIQEHPVRSHRVVQQVPQLAAALDGILHHHERYDGSGYPAGLKGEEIPLQARIIQIADVFDALTSSRSYRPAYDWRKALDILREEAGKTVDPNLQQVFDRHMRPVLESDPRAWERMVEHANRFASAFGGGDAEQVMGGDYAEPPSPDIDVGRITPPGVNAGARMGVGGGV